MPATFTTILAEHITRQCGIPCAEAKDGEPLVGGRIYLAPGDFHMVLATRGDRYGAVGQQGAAGEFLPARRSIP